MDYEKINLLKTRIDKQRESKPSAASDNKADKVKTPSVFGWRWAWGILIASFLAWVPFFGYTHLLKMLETAGFSGVYINPKTYDLVYYFLLGWSEVVNNGLSFLESEKILNVSFKLLIFAPPLGSLLTLLIWWTVSFAKKNKVVAGKPERKAIYHNVSKVLIDSTESWRGFFRLWVSMIILIFSTAIVEIIAFISLFILSSFLWFLSLTGYLSGISAGKDVVLETKCGHREPSKSEMHDTFRIGCSLMKIEGKAVEGGRIYSDEKHIFFIGDEGAYQTDYQGNLILFSPIERLKSKEDKESTGGSDK